MASDLVVVPGGAGFIGSHLCERLLAQGARVLAIDNLSSGHVDSVEALLARPEFTLLPVDLVKGWPAVAREPALIFNLACPASPAHYQRNPVQTTLTSAVGMWHVLEAGRTSGARVLQTSTSEVYGEPEQHPQAETYWGHVNPIGPRSCYDEGKRCAEALCYAYVREHAMEVRVARLFNCYGPRLRPGDGRVVSNFVVQALRHEPITVYGDGQQTRSFCYVDDTVDGLLKLMASNVGEPVNLGNPREHTVLQLAEAVLRLTRSRSTLRHLPLPIDDPHRRRPDIARARTRLGWEPRVALEDGLRETIAYFRRELGVADAVVSVSALGVAS